jgi:hypothetical protein
MSSSQVQVHYSYDTKILFGGVAIWFNAPKFVLVLVSQTSCLASDVDRRFLYAQPVNVTPTNAGRRRHAI